MSSKYLGFGDILVNGVPFDTFRYRAGMSYDVAQAVYDANAEKYGDGTVKAFTATAIELGAAQPVRVTAVESR